VPRTGDAAAGHGARRRRPATRPSGVAGGPCRSSELRPQRPLIAQLSRWSMRRRPDPLDLPAPLVERLARREPAVGASSAGSPASCSPGPPARRRADPRPCSISVRSVRRHLLAGAEPPAAPDLVELAIRAVWEPPCRRAAQKEEPDAIQHRRGPGLYGAFEDATQAPETCLHPDFVGHVARACLRWGGPHVGPEKAMLTEVWAPVGRRFRVRPVPSDFRALRRRHRWSSRDLCVQPRHRMSPCTAAFAHVARRARRPGLRAGRSPTRNAGRGRGRPTPSVRRTVRGGGGTRDRLARAGRYATDVVIREATSLPYGGAYHGHAGRLAMPGLQRHLGITCSPPRTQFSHSPMP